MAEEPTQQDQAAAEGAQGKDAGLEQADTEAAVETPEAATEAEPKDDTRQLWGKIVPELADEFDNLAPETRETLLLNRLDAQSSVESPAEAGADKPAASQEGQQADQPPVGEVPKLDVEPIRAALTEEVGEEAAKKVCSALEGYTGNLANLVLGSIADGRKEVAGFGKTLTQYTRPQKLRALVPGVKGATDADVRAATEIMDKGDVASEEAALKLAVFNRQGEVARAAPTASAKDKAAAIEAARQAGSGRRGGQAPQSIPESADGIAALYAADAKKKK